MYLSAYPSPRRPAAPKSHARVTGWDDPAPGEEPTKVAGVAGFVRTAVELLRRDPPAAHDMMRT
ncbi:MAG: hypothetical protein IT373_09095, partial [Polyangiaceae bacterium]|nr:hypothetical protein [Polyangiaceae bacterium]